MRLPEYPSEGVLNDAENKFGDSRILISPWDFGKEKRRKWLVKDLSIIRVGRVGWAGWRTCAGRGVQKRIVPDRPPGRLRV